MLPRLCLLSLFATACTAPLSGPSDDQGGDDVEAPDAGTPDDCEVPALTGGVSTLAGCGAAGTSDGERDVARFANPVNVAIGADGEVYVADFDNNRVRVIERDGSTRTLIEQENFARPFGLAVVGSTLYVQTDDNDRGEHSDMTGTIWRVDTATGAASVVARDLGRPRGLLALPGGRLAISDHKHHAVRLIDIATGAVSDLAGSFDQAGMTDARGGAARFSAPYGLALLPDGRIAVADYGNNRIRAIELDGDVTTLAGTGTAGAADGGAAAASFDAPQDVAADSAGNLYVADSDNFQIRKLTADGQVITLVGDGTGGYRDSAELLDARIFGLEGIDVSADGTRLVIADGSRGDDGPYHRVRTADL